MPSTTTLWRSKVILSLIVSNHQSPDPITSPFDIMSHQPDTVQENNVNTHLSCVANCLKDRLSEQNSQHWPSFSFWDVLNSFWVLTCRKNAQRGNKDWGSGYYRNLGAIEQESQVAVKAYATSPSSQRQSSTISYKMEHSPRQKSLSLNSSATTQEEECLEKDTSVSHAATITKQLTYVVSGSENL